MKSLPSVSQYGLVPIPPMSDTQACRDNKIERLTADNVNVSRLALMWIELREIAGLASIIIGLSIFSVGVAVALAIAH